MSREVRWPVALTGGLVAIHWVTFFAAIKASTVSLALAVMATVPFFVSLIEPVVRRRKRLDVTELLLGLVAIVGLWWMYRVDVDLWQGMVLALMSAFSAALFGTPQQCLEPDAHRHWPSVRGWSWPWHVSCWAVYGFGPGRGSPSVPTPADWGWLLLLGIGGHVGGFRHHRGGDAGPEPLHRGDGHQPRAALRHPVGAGDLRRGGSHAARVLRGRPC